MDPLAPLGFRASSTRSLGLAPGSGHQHLDVELNLAEEAPARYLLGGRAHEVPPGCLFAFWAGHPHHLLEYPRERPVLLHWITVPLAWLHEWGFDGRFLGALLRGELVADAGMHGDPARMREWTTLIEAGGEERLIALHEVHARMRRMQRSWLAGKSLPSERQEHLPQPVQRMLSALLAGYRDDCGAETVAAAAGLHPNYAMTVFRRSCGMTIHRYLVELRLTHAQRLLLTTDRSIIDIAQDSGFGSPSRFYAAFKRRWGIPPAAYRERRPERP